MGPTLVVLIRGLRRRHSLARAVHRKDLLATAFASVGDGILLTDRERRIIFANQAALHLTGWSEEDLLKTPCASVVRCMNSISRKAEECAAMSCLKSGRPVRL